MTLFVQVFEYGLSARFRRNFRLNGGHSDFRGNDILHPICEGEQRFPYWLPTGYLVGP